MLLLLGIVITLNFNDAKAQGEPFNAPRVVANGFSSAWEVVYGPNDSLWVTENVAYRIQRVSIATGAKTLLRDIIPTEPLYNFATGKKPQGGLMGMVLHPNLYSTNPAVRAAKPWVYVVYVYRRDHCPTLTPAAADTTKCYFTTKIVRFTYSGNTLTSPVIILDNIPGSSDHNSGRLAMSPVIEPGADAAHTQYRLYYTIGDMGAGQFKNTTRQQHAPRLDSLPGKVLRLNTESDGDAGLDAWIPNDNPFYNGAVIQPRDYVYSYGHRNPQGLVWGLVNGSYKLYSSEQMDQTDDEINIIEPGKHYGWDSCTGEPDGNVNGHRQGQTHNVNEQNFANAAWNSNLKEPMFAFYKASAADVTLASGQGNQYWPTIAPSSIAYYGLTKIPGWQHSILMTALKKNFIYRLKLNSTGDAVIDTIKYFSGFGNRIRRVTISPDGRKFYIAYDAGSNFAAHSGAIVEYVYAGVTLPLPDQPGPVTPEKDEVDIFPNPVSDIITIKGKKNLHKPLRVQLFDMSGVMVKEETTTKNEFTINVAHLKSGMYVVKLFNGYNVEVKVEKIYKK
jgi:PQQ-dependent dehydrogenase (s-GDH family)